jgi:tripartite-type tricarboxylate transporter receptor subunit TctC
MISRLSPLAASAAFLFSRKTMPAKDVNELVAWLKANPNKASAGFAVSALRLISLLFQKETGAQFTLVPYRGHAPAYQDLVAGQIDLMVGSPDALPLVRAGSIKAHAVISDTRSAFAPDIPTLAEMGLLAIPYAGWYGLFAPRGTPKDIIDRLNGATVAALAYPAVRSRLGDLGVEIYPREQQTPEALGTMQKAMIEKWWPVIRELGIKAE